MGCYTKKLKRALINGVQLAQYKHWRSIQTGVPNLMSVEDKRLLGL